MFVSCGNSYSTSQCGSTFNFENSISHRETDGQFTWHVSRVGLTLTLNIGQDDYVREFGGSAGVRIVVHPQERMPFPSDEGVLAAPGQLSIIGIRQVGYVERLLTATKLHERCSYHAMASPNI